eukprot:CAMPEP_0181123342 /NCGR_PEP_ID=MMETSP1071-20121207/25847_1 /TAXON_ID=35127 /ORGANISM="Thalassiosira sp., Strain NH16" /LENGTH=222 /DNA_ID=CAMNT_0023208475 /DNA_START=61 /DNA_END=726 /DNA_ORIENTATION=-
MMEGSDQDFSGAEATSANVRRAVQYWLDKSTIHILPRWILFSVVLLLFFLRIYLVQSHFIVAYGLGIFLLNNFILFLSPLDDPRDAGGGGDDGLSLPSTAKQGKEYRPFARRLPEFKFWMACTRGSGTALVMTLFSLFDVPVFWPILLMYFGVLFFMTMRRQIGHMIKHKYVPISFGKHKPKAAGKETGDGGQHWRRGCQKKGKLGVVLAGCSEDRLGALSW